MGAPGEWSPTLSLWGDAYWVTSELPVIRLELDFWFGEKQCGTGLRLIVYCVLRMHTCGVVAGIDGDRISRGFHCGGFR